MEEQFNKRRMANNAEYARGNISLGDVLEVCYYDLKEQFSALTCSCGTCDSEGAVWTDELKVSNTTIITDAYFTDVGIAYTGLSKNSLDKKVGTLTFPLKVHNPIDSRITKDCATYQDDVHTWKKIMSFPNVPVPLKVLMKEFFVVLVYNKTTKKGIYLNEDLYSICARRGYLKQWDERVSKDFPNSGEYMYNKDLNSLYGGYGV